MLVESLEVHSELFRWEDQKSEIVGNFTIEKLS